MNILHLNDKIEISGGVEVYISYLIELLPAYGIKQNWIGVNENSSNYDVSFFEDSSNNLLDISFNKLLQFIKEFVRENKIDLIHIHSISNPKLIDFCFGIAPVVRSMHEPRIVCPGHGKFLRYSERICDKDFGFHCLIDIYKEGCSNRHPKRVVKAIANTYFEINTASNKYSSVIVMSEYMKNEALSVGFKKDTISYNPYFTPIVSETDIFNRKNDKVKTLLFIGRLSRTKGTHYFIELGISLLEKGFDINFSIVGDGYDKTFFESIIPVAQRSKFIFHGWKNKEEIQEILNKSYLLVFPSIYPEAFGIVGIEALMRGLPVVGFDVGGVSTWLKDEVNGYLVPVKNTEVLTARVERLLLDEELYSKMSLQAREITLEYFSPKVHLEKLIKLYTEILESK